jgi:NADPH:quinone reductase-like Zn-dependent oxidoreductase
MKAIQVSSSGAPEVLRLAELPDPAPGPGEVAIDVTHAAVGLIDVFIRQGLYRDRPGLPQPPYVPGLEVAGTVRALGEGVCRVRGRRARGDLTGQQPARGAMPRSSSSTRRTSRR